MKPLELHRDYSAVDNSKVYTLHRAGCSHRSRGNVSVFPVTGLGDAICVEVRQLDWNIHIAPCAKVSK